MGPITAKFAPGRENEMLFAFEPKKFVRRWNVKSVPVGIVGRAQFCTVRLRAADTRHDQVVLMNESVLGEVGFHGVPLVPP